LQNPVVLDERTEPNPDVVLADDRTAFLVLRVCRMSHARLSLYDRRRFR
jgi:hypothetical protein